MTRTFLPATLPVHDESGDTRPPCHFCDLPIDEGDKRIESNNTPGVWAHVTCWYDGGPFEREMREKGARVQ